MCVCVCVCVYIYIYIQCDQKASVHMTITAHHQVHRDFLITLYIYIYIYIYIYNFHIGNLLPALRRNSCLHLIQIHCYFYAGAGDMYSMAGTPSRQNLSMRVGCPEFPSSFAMNWQLLITFF